MIQNLKFEGTIIITKIDQPLFICMYEEGSTPVWKFNLLFTKRIEGTKLYTYRGIYIELMFIYFNRIISNKHVFIKHRTTKTN